ncbi:hypothetical protein OQA88_652 [Cercophora sp. LCS_1]
MPSWLYSRKHVLLLLYMFLVEAFVLNSTSVRIAYAVQHDPRVTAIGVFNSGIKNETEFAKSLADRITKPIFFFLGGPTDVVYPNGERAYARIPKGTPKWKGNLDVGRGGDYSRPNCGKFAVAASNWLKWVLRGNSNVAPFFTGSGHGTAAGAGWVVEHRDLENIKVSSWD